MKTLAKSLMQIDTSTLTPRITSTEAPANAFTPPIATLTATMMSAVAFSTMSTVIVSLVWVSVEKGLDQQEWINSNV